MVTIAERSAHCDVIIKWNSDNSINVKDLSNVVLQPFSVPFNSPVHVALRSDRNQTGTIAPDVICVNSSVEILFTASPKNLSVSDLFMLSNQNRCQWTSR